MLERLGVLLYWVGNIAATLWAALFFFVALIGTNGSTAMIAAAVGAIAIWLIGRAARYLFAGR